MSLSRLDAVKRNVAEHWGRRAPTFDREGDHSIGSPGERAAWDRVLRLICGGRRELRVLDAGCGTGFLAFELAALGHHVTGVDFAPAMLAEARQKAAAAGGDVTFEEADAESLPYPPDVFDLVISRHLIWTLPRPETAIDEWIRVLRQGGRLSIVDGQFAVAGPSGDQQPVIRRTDEYAGIVDQLPFMGGRPMTTIVALLEAHGLTNVQGDPLLDLVAAQEQQAIVAGREPRGHPRYAVWGDKPAS